ncbi:MAG: permease-like cell division protein FtsX [Polyangia bacterium]|jgi:cell division transport system permease protein|nr:permease-like cell division protein FtsX [Polyangia bacterium]
MRSIGYHLKRTLSGLGARPLALLLTLGSVALAFLLVGSVFLTAHNLSRLTDLWGAGATVAVDLAEGAPPAEVARVEQALREIKGVRAVKRVSPVMAKARLMRLLGEDAPVIASVEAGFLPSSLEVTIGGDRQDVLGAQQRISRMSGVVPGVEAVQTVETWFHRLDRLISGIRLAAAGLGLLVLVACAYIIMVTIRLRFVDRRQELQVMRLMGATERFIRIPYLLEGMWHGLLGAALALCLLLVGHHLLTARAETLFGAGVHPSQLGFLPLGQLACGLAIGGLCGLAGALVATRQPSHG